MNGSVICYANVTSGTSYGRNEQPRVPKGEWDLLRTEEKIEEIEKERKKLTRGKCREPMSLMKSQKPKPLVDTKSSIALADYVLRELEFTDIVRD